LSRLQCLILKINLGRMTRTFLVLMLSFLAAGCADTSHYVKVLPVPPRTFPPTEPALIRLPVEILFPSGAEVVRHVTDFFKNELRPKMDHPIKVPGARLKFSVADLWKKIQEPIYLDKGIWLLIRPQTLSLGSVRTNPKNPFSAHAGLETTANPEVIFGPKPLTTPAPIPKLGPYIPGPATFQAVSNTRISYKEVNQHFKDPRMKLIGMVMPGTGGQKVTLTGLRMYGSGGQVVVEVKIHYEPLIINLGSKPAKLTIYLKGTPHYLPKEQAFDLPDLDYDVKSSDLMVQMADMLFKTDFKNQLRQIARLPIGPKMDELTGKINLALNRPLGRFTKMKANVTSFKVLDGLADNEGIVVRVFIKGTAALDMTWN
jgi:hypothetical protein